MKEKTIDMCIRWWKLYDINEELKSSLKTKDYSKIEINKIRKKIDNNAKEMQKIKLELEIRDEISLLLSCNH